MSIYWFLTLLSVVTARRLLPRQTGNTTTALITTAPPQPCCWIYPGQRGVKFHTWYTSAVTQYTATVVTTFLQYNNTKIAVNSSTSYMAASDVFSAYGLNRMVDIPGVPTTLIPLEVVEALGGYASTMVVPANATTVTFDYTDLVIHSPTPYIEFPYVRVFTEYASTKSDGVWEPLTTAYVPSLCGQSSTGIEYLTFSDSTWTYTTRTELVPSANGFTPGEIFHDDDEAFGNDNGYVNYPYVATLPAALPMAAVFLSLPDGVSASLVSNTTLLSLSPWVTDCWTFGAEGQPTVHVEVAQLTSESTVILTTNAVLGRTTAMTPIRTPNPNGANAVTRSDTIPDASTAEAVQPTTAESPAATNKAQTAATQVPPAITAITSKAVVASAVQAIVTLGSTTATLLVESSAIVFAGSTLSVGQTFSNENLVAKLILPSDGLALSFNDKTVILPQASTKSGVAIAPTAVAVVNGQITTLQAAQIISGGAVVIDGVTVKQDQITVLNGNTISLVGTQSAAVVNGVTIKPGNAVGPLQTQSIAGSAVTGDSVNVKPAQVTVINGQTISLASTSSIVTGAQSTSTGSLGSAVVSGNGGTGSGQPYKGGAVAIQAESVLVLVYMLGLMCL